MIAVRISRWLRQLRATRGPALLSRMVIGLSGGLVLMLLAGQPWDALDAPTVIAGIALLVCMGAPDSPAPLVFMIAIAAGWLTRGPATPGWPILTIALTLMVLHLACAFAGQFPAYAEVDGRVLSSWLPPATIAATITAFAAGLSTIIHGTTINGSLTITVAALTGLTFLLWLTTHD